MLGLDVPRLAEIVAQLVELDRRQAGGGVATRAGGAPASRTGAERELPGPLADRERAVDRVMDRRLAERPPGRPQQVGEEVDAVLAGVLGQRRAVDRRDGRQQVGQADRVVAGGTGLDLA